MQAHIFHIVLENDNRCLYDIQTAIILNLSLDNPTKSGQIIISKLIQNYCLPHIHRMLDCVHICNELRTRF